MSIQSVVANELIQNASSVWVLKEHQNFGYSDGAQSEQYLERVFLAASDLSVQSSELEGYIKDWPSEYHLTTKRAQLLAGFSFDRSLKVLEVGCGCGAITRHLGENFDDVVSIEGSIRRARLARLRTRDLKGVSIVCAPFQEINFIRKFDIIFCIGVYEYSGSFVEGESPYDSVLRYFNKILTPNGLLVIAIENQFGLKYFGSCREDHLGVPFEGLEGYRVYPDRVRTFGRTELEDNLKRHFRSTKFYYPYPDYKLPDCVLSEEFLLSGKAGELVSQMKSRDYGGSYTPLFDEALVSLELARNRMLPFFSSSFLAVAGKGGLDRVSFGQLAIMFSSSRRGCFRTTTRLVQDESGGVRVLKTSVSQGGEGRVGRLRLVDSVSVWQECPSLHTVVYVKSRSRAAGIVSAFLPCKQWVNLLEAASFMEAGVRYLDGEYLDCIWSNVYPGSGGCEFVDREWIWGERIRLNALVVRAIYMFVSSAEAADQYATCLKERSGRRLIREIAEGIGVTLEREDFNEFVRLESEFQSIAYGIDQKRISMILRWFLFDRPSLGLFRSIRQRLNQLLASLGSRAAGLVGVRTES